MGVCASERAERASPHGPACVDIVQGVCMCTPAVRMLSCGGVASCVNDALLAASARAPTELARASVATRPARRTLVLERGEGTGTLQHECRAPGHRQHECQARSQRNDRCAAAQWGSDHCAEDKRSETGGLQVSSTTSLVVAELLQPWLLSTGWSYHFLTLIVISISISISR